jgi:2-polyprenyl-3-methyl-5-hydroxy-6-metoxy-1,4-benzoquinol methylase
VVQRHVLQPKSWSRGSHIDRFAAIRPYVEGRTVLDVGAASGHRREDWMHGLIASVAQEALAIDHDEAIVAELCRRGVDVVYGDAQALALGRTFDVVFAGEVIEHLDDFRGFLSSARSHLRPGGTLVLTTPNAFAISNFIYRIGGQPRINADHRCWFCEDTIRQLLERNGFSIREIGYIRHRTPSPVRRVFGSTIRRLLPQRLAWGTLLIVAEPVA